MNATLHAARKMFKNHGYRKCGVILTGTREIGGIAVGKMLYRCAKKELAWLKWVSG